MAKTSVLKTLKESKWDLRKCRFAPQPHPKSQKANAVGSFPASQWLGHVPSAEFSEVGSPQLSASL